MSEKKVVTANLTMNCDAHGKMRKLARKTGLTNREVIEGLLEGLTEAQAEELLSSKVEEKQSEKQNRINLKREVGSMSPERVKEILKMLHKNED
ncbi:hypothetical protein R2R70_02230 [Cobetia sp. SIMBA_158]|uniref:hypothetical protein n=1 Tax=Cobetia sp. SIMBA_158 TaxID=3081617 RepID=UPI0039805482